MELRLVTLEDTSKLWMLIESNRDRLRRYFPKTTAAISSPITTQAFVAQKIRQAQRQEHFFFLLIDHRREVIGNISLKNIDWTVPKGELAYFIDRNQEGKGYISYAMDRILPYCFGKLGLEKLYVRVSPDNLASKRIAQKQGFIREGVLREEYRTGDGDLIDVDYYGLLRRDYEAQQSGIPSGSPPFS